VAFERLDEKCCCSVLLEISSVGGLGSKRFIRFPIPTDLVLDDRYRLWKYNTRGFLGQGKKTTRVIFPLKKHTRVVFLLEFKGAFHLQFDPCSMKIHH
jgi:hypothetical protein